MSNTIIIKNREPQAISIRGGGEVLGITTVYVNGIDVTEGSVAYVIVPTKTSELTNDSGFINHEVDPTVPYYVKQITQADINSWNNKQDELVSGTNIKTINSNSLLGSGNIDISTSYTAGTGININSENVISNTITSYNDLTDLPTIPTSTSELLNDSGYLVADDLANVAFSGSYADLSDVPDLSEYATLDTEELENYYTKRFMWNILPRATGSGVSVSLSDTLNEAPIELSLAPSELSQEATPTPDSPQVVHTISGDNTISISDGTNSQEADIKLGVKNLFTNSNITLISEGSITDDIITSTENATAGTKNTVIYYSSNTISIKAGQTLYFSADIKLNDESTGNFGNINDGVNGATTKIVQPTLSTEYQRYQTSFTYSNNSTINRILIQVGSLKGTFSIKNIQISFEKSVSYSAYGTTPIEYCKIGNYADEFIKTSGKNLFDKDNLNLLTDYYVDSSAKIVSGTANKLCWVKLEPNTTYTLTQSLKINATVRIGLFDTQPVANATGTLLGTFSGTNAITQTFTTTSTAVYLAWVYVNTNYLGNYTEQQYLDSIMLNLGSTALDYEPYGLNEWYIKKNIGKVVLDGTESTWNGTDPYFVRLTTKGISNEVMGMSNYFLGTSNDNRATGSNIIYFDGDLCYIRHTTFSDLATFRTWLGTHNTTVYYVLATPTYTQITGTLETQLENAYYNLTAYDNQTNISQTNNDLPFVISASTPKTLVNM